MFAACLVGIVQSALSSSASAQITPDDTLGTERSRVTTTTIGGSAAERIDGGARRGANLFHSFQEFNVGDRQRVYFSNPAGVSHILSRVTGNDVSDILGTLGVDGTANLFLLNPNGFVFGANAQLDLRGSFLASTAHRFQLNNGQEFSAIQPQAPSLLSINVPIGLQYGQTPGAIAVNQSRLSIGGGHSLMLAGGAVTLEGAQLQAGGGRIEIVGINGSGTVALDPIDNGFRLNPVQSSAGSIARSNLTLQNDTVLNTIAANAGNITLDGNRVTLDRSRLLVGTSAGIPGASVNNQAGDITIRATGLVNLVSSNLLNWVFPSGNPADPALGSAGDIVITANALWLSSGSRIDSSTFGRGNGGDIRITLGDRLLIDGFNPNGDVTGIIANVKQSGIGQGGDVQLSAGRLISLTNGALVTSSTSGRGDAGSVALSSDRIEIDGFNPRDVTTNSAVTSDVQATAQGQGGAIRLTANSIALTNGGGIADLTRGQGDAGDLSINARDQVLIRGTNGSFDPSTRRSSTIITSVLGGSGRGGDVEIVANDILLLEGGEIITSNIQGQGTAGNVALAARDRLVIDGYTTNRLPSAILTKVEERAIGRGGEVRLSGNTVEVAHGAAINSATNGRGNAGSVLINARDRIRVDGVVPSNVPGDSGFPSRITAAVEGNGNGSGGRVQLNANRVWVTNGALISTATNGQGDAGSVVINARDRIRIDGLGRERNSLSQIQAQVEPRGRGQGGTVQLSAPSIAVTGGGLISTSTNGRGDAGNLLLTGDRITIDGTTPDRNIRSQALALVAPTGVGQGGTVRVTANTVSLTNGGAILANLDGQGRGGRIIVQARDRLVARGRLYDTQRDLSSGIFTLLTRTGQGEGGSIQVSAPRVILQDGAQFSSLTSGLGNAGDIQVRTNALLLSQGAALDASTVGQGNGGTILVQARDRVEVDGVRQRPFPRPSDQQRVDPSSIATSTFSDGGQGGDVRIRANRVAITRGGQLAAATFGRQRAGDIVIVAGDRIRFDGTIPGEHSASVAVANTFGAGNGGDIALTASVVDLTRGGRLFTSTFAAGRAGNITVRARDRITIDGASPNRQISSAALAEVLGENGSGQGGTIRMTADSIAITNGGEIGARTSGSGNAGSIVLQAADNLTIRGTTLPTRFNPVQPSQVTVASSSPSRAGNLTLATPRLSIGQGAIASVSAPNGQAGTLTVNAAAINLDRGRLTAVTGTNGRGANINLQGLNLLQMSDRSQISAAALGRARGGNVNINPTNQGTGFIVATPNQDNDILASAFQGRGGEININTQGIFGLSPLVQGETRSPNSNDINATSRFSAPGTVTINRPEVDPSRGIVDLPTAFIRPEPMQGCQVAGGEATATFYDTGRGGLPPSPYEPLTENDILTDLRSSRSDSSANGGSRESLSQIFPDSSSETSEQTASPIVEAQGWLKDEDGKVRLVADNPAIRSPHHCPLRSSF